MISSKVFKVGLGTGAVEEKEKKRGKRWRGKGGMAYNLHSH